jgi:hypothetical protein
MPTHDSLEVTTVYDDPGPLCKCEAKREGPGPDHAPGCAWYANTRCKKIRLITPEEHKKMDIGPLAQFYFIPWVKK